MKNRILFAAAAAVMLTGCGAVADNATDYLLEPPGAASFGSSEKYGNNNVSARSVIAGKYDTESLTENVPEIDEEPQKITPAAECRVHFLCAGDNLIHDNIYHEAMRLGVDHYDFTSFYDEVRPYVAKADVAVLNQETLVNDLYEAESYPVFSTPTEDGDAVVDLGFNVISMSNNHVLDKGSAGLINSLDYWDTKPVVHYGAYRSREDSENIRTLEVNGIKFAFLGYMEHTNGVILSDTDEGWVTYLKEEQVIEEQVKRADEMADVVVVSCHFGTEILHELNDQQLDMAPKLAEWGADLIIGTQAHCVSTCDYVDGKNGNRAFCYYGLGNFFHTMADAIETVGIMGDLDIIKGTDGQIRFENIKAIPVVSHFEGDDYYSDWYNCKVYPYAKYTDELLSRSFALDMSRAELEDCLSWIPEQYLSIE